MKNSGGSLAFNGQDNADKPSKANTKYDYNQSRLSPVQTGTRTNLKGNIGGSKSHAAPDQASNDHGPIVGTAKPANRHDGAKTDKHVAVTTTSTKRITRGNQ